MWRYKYKGSNYRMLHYPLSNDNKDFTEAPKITWTDFRSSGQVICAALPYFDVTMLSRLVDTVVLGSQLQDQPTTSREVMQSQNQWFLQISHKIHHLEKHKEEFAFTKVMGTAYRYSKYREYFVIVGRDLKEPLMKGGWKHCVVDKVVIGPKDFLLQCKLEDTKWWLPLILELHNVVDLCYVAEGCFCKSSFWEAKDNYNAKFKGALCTQKSS